VKISSPPEFDPRTVQPVASRYTDWATRPTVNYVQKSNIFVTNFHIFKGCNILRTRTECCRFCSHHTKDQSIPADKSGNRVSVWMSCLKIDNRADVFGPWAFSSKLGLSKLKLQLSLSARHDGIQKKPSHNFIIFLDNERRWEQSTSRFTSGKDTQNPMHRMYGGTQSRSERCEQEKNILSLSELKLPDRTVRTVWHTDSFLN
jgi:hypothetical protein